MNFIYYTQRPTNPFVQCPPGGAEFTPETGGLLTNLYQRNL